MSDLCFVHGSLDDVERRFINRGVCDGLPINHIYKGDNYCVLHFPDEKKHKTTDFESVAMDKLDKQKNDFRYVYFDGGVIWTKHTFKTKTSFLGATFLKGAMFSECVFNEKIIFSGINFYGDVFFRDAVFCKETYFIGTRFFNDTFFTKTIFNEESQVFFNDAVFYDRVNFSYSVFKNYVAFDGEQTFNTTKTKVNFQNIRLENPEKISFANIQLRPSWLIELDSRKLNFVNVSWKNVGKISAKKNIIAELKNIPFENSSTLLKIAFRQLAENAENNNRLEEASNFRRMAFETEWLEKKEKISNWIKNLVPESEKLKRRFGGSNNEEDKPIPPTNSIGILRRSGDFFIHGLYRITSFYGESGSLGFGVLLTLIFIVFPLIYTQTQFQTSPKAIPLEVVVVTDCKNVVEESKPVCSQIKQGGLGICDGEAILHSLTAVTFQDVEYRKPISGWAEFWTILEKIVAPLQAALLALAIRRKFMR